MATGPKSSQPNLASQVMAVLRKDLYSEFRTPSTFITMAIFSLVTITIISIAMGVALDRKLTIGMIPSTMWVAFSFAAMLGLNHAFATERDSGCIHALLLTPVPRGVLFFGKGLTNFVMVLAVELVSLPAIIVFFDVENLSTILLPLLVVIVLSTVGICAVGTLFSAMATSGNQREVMLPVLLFPVLIPLLSAAVRGTQAVFDRAEALQIGFPRKSLELANTRLTGNLGLLVGYDILFIVFSALLFRFVVEE